MAAYSSRTRVGNWQEEMAKEEEMLKSFVQRQETGSLGASQKLLSQSLRKVTLSNPGDGLVHYGDQVNLAHEGSGKVLSACFSAHVPAAYEGCTAVTAADAEAPAKRNVFEIVPVQGEEDELAGRPLCFGDKFRLRVWSLDDEDLYLYSERVSLYGGNADLSGQQAAALKPAPEGLRAPGGIWQVVFFEPDERVEREGTPVGTEGRVLLLNTSTNQKLAALDQYLVRSEYGVEYEVTCQTTLTKHKIEDPVNFWVFKNGDSPGVDQ